MIRLEEKLNRSDILNLFKCKQEETVGIEYERIPILNSSFKSATYDNGICEFLRQFAREDNWDYITDEYNIIGIKQNHSTITLEPGCQTELSIKPQKTIYELKNEIDTLNKKFEPILNKLGITLLNYGISPLSTYQNINLIPKRRYKIMASYLWGILSDVMMRETAGIQATFDFSSEEDAAKKIKVANKLTPFITAMFANSPIRGGVDTGYKTFRALSWLNTDNERCGFANNLDEDFSFEKYVDSVLNSPIIFINKNDETIAINGKLTFNEYMQNGFEQQQATLNDFILHSNLYFPEVRIRNFIEIRNHDCNHMPFAILAIYKGILYNQNALDEIEELFKTYSHNDFEELRYDVPKSALQCKFGKYLVLDFAKEILNLSEKYLRKTNENNFLDPIKELTFNGLCPADIILRNWNGLWNKDINKLISYLKKLSV